MANLAKIRKKIALKIILGILAIAFIFTLGFSAGWGSSSGLKFYQVINKERKVENLDFSLFWKTWDTIHSSYLHQYNNKTLFYSAIKGLVAGLDDPYSAFLDPEETELFSEDMKEEFGGVGIEITMRDNKIVVVSALKDSAAEKTGLKTGDEIVKVDNKDTQNEALMKVLTWIRGEAGTKVKLQINRVGWAEPKEFELTRYNIKIESVKWHFENDLVIIQISQFSDQTTTLVNQAADEILQKKPKGIILDLRNNAGGLLESSVQIASLFIEKGAVVYERDNKKQDKGYEVTGEAKLKDFPLMVLVNNGSASASEILAGALAFYKKGTLIGEKTFGKGVMQSWDSYPDGSSLILTIAYWLTPGKVQIDKKGINPDIIINSDKIDCGNDDAVCQKAKELLRK